MTAPDLATTSAQAFASLLWPVLAFVVAVALLSLLRGIVRQRQFTIQTGVFDPSARQAAQLWRRRGRGA